MALCCDNHAFFSIKVKTIAGTTAATIKLRINSTKYLVDTLSNVKKKKKEITTCLHAAAGVKFLSQILCL